MKANRFILLFILLQTIRQSTIVWSEKSKKQYLNGHIQTHAKQWIISFSVRLRSIRSAVKRRPKIRADGTNFNFTVLHKNRFKQFFPSSLHNERLGTYWMCCAHGMCHGFVCNDDPIATSKTYIMFYVLFCFPFHKTAPFPKVFSILFDPVENVILNGNTLITIRSTFNFSVRTAHSCLFVCFRFL